MSQVDIPSLREIGAKVQGCASGFEKAHTAQSGQLAGDGLADWSTGVTLDTAANAWGTFLTQLTGQVRNLGQGLSRSANEFEAADDAAADRVTGAGKPAGDRPR